MGKFDTKSYAVSGGTNGVGLTCANALSTEFLLETSRDGFVHYFKCEKGLVTTKLTKGKKTKKTGTFVKFNPDGSILDTTEWNVEKLEEMCKLAALLNNGLTVTFEVESSKKKETFLYDNGAKSFVEEKIAELKKDEKSLKVVLPDTQFISETIMVKESNKESGEKSEKEVVVDISFNYTTSDKESYHTFVNGIRTPLGGSHLTGTRLALSKAIMAHIKSNDLLGKRDKNLKITGEDCREGLVYFVSVRFPEPQFHSQTKDELGSREGQSATQTVMGQYLKELFSSDPKIVKLICDRVISSARARVAAKKAREVVRKEFTDTSLSLPTKLKDCVSTDPDECELFIVEGK